MSELKVIHAYTFDEIEIISTHSNGNDYYLKSEADKLIAELNMRICDGDEDFEIANNQIKRLLKIVRHQKYKRCVAMASYWIAVSYQCVDDKHRQNAEKRHHKWLKLTEQFKEEK